MSSNISISPGTKVSQTTSPKKPNQSQETQQGEVREQQQELMSSQTSHGFMAYGQVLLYQNKPNTQKAEQKENMLNKVENSTNTQQIQTTLPKNSNQSKETQQGEVREQEQQKEIKEDAEQLFKNLDELKSQNKTKQLEELISNNLKTIINNTSDDSQYKKTSIGFLDTIIKKINNKMFISDEDENTVSELLNNIDIISKLYDSQETVLCTLLKATKKASSKTLVNNAIQVFSNNTTKEKSIRTPCMFKQLINIVNNNSLIFGSNTTIQNLVNIWDTIEFEETKDTKTNKTITAKQNRNLSLYYIAHATAKSTSLNNDTMTILLDKINDISNTTNENNEETKTKKQNQSEYLFILSQNLKINKEVNKDMIESLFNKALDCGMFKDETNPAVQRTFVRNLIDAASRLDKDEAQGLYETLYKIATTTKDNTNPVQENDGKNDIGGFGSENLPNNAQSSYMPPKLILFFAKLDKTLGYQDVQIQTDLINAITHRKDGNEDANLDPKVPLCPALNYLQKEQLKDIDESAIVNRIITTNDAKDIDAKDIQQFELEYLIDLKLSHELYELNTDKGQDTLINILTTHYDILTNKFEPEMASKTQTSQLPGDVPNNDEKIKLKIALNTTMNVPDKAYDGVYNLALIALKQMEPKDRGKFLNKLIDDLKSKNTDTTKSYTINLLEKLKTNEQFDNDKLLTTRPVLRQYNEKGKTVSKNYQPNLTSFRMPRTTDKCEIFKENGINYLGFKGTNQKIETSLDTKTAERLFGSQSSSGHQIIGNCWLISTLKQIEANPQLKLFIYSHFDAEFENGELASVTIKLKNENKVTFSKDVVDEVSKIGATEHLSPAMSCLALLSAIYRTPGIKHDISKIDKPIDSKSLQVKFPENKYNPDYLDDSDNLDKLDNSDNSDNLDNLDKLDKLDDLNDLNDLDDLDDLDDSDDSDDLTYLIKEIDNEPNEQIITKELKNAIINALRISNHGGEQYKDVLSLFINDDERDDIKDNTQSNSVNTTQIINLYKHAIGKYGDFYLNPQNSHSLFIFDKAIKEDEEKAVTEKQKEIYVNKIYKKDDTSYTIPEF